MILYYESSNGQVFDLKDKLSHFRTRTANFHDYGWTPKVIEQQYGARVYRFDKGAVTYTALLSVFGSMDERRQWLNVLHAAFDADIANLTPGKIVHGMYEIECFITMSSTFYQEPWTQNQIQIYCPYPFWMAAQPYKLKRQESDSLYPFLDFPYDFPYDYQAVLPGYASIKNDASTACDWKITMHGPATDPVIAIDGQQIGVYASIGADEDVVISSSDKTVIKKGPSGEQNLFNNRIKTANMFDQLTAGNHSVIWSGTFEVDVVLYQRRSEPPWI